MRETLVVDDESSDRSAQRIRALNLDRVRILRGQPLLIGWSGILWALAQGREHATTELLLLLDADIELKPALVATLRRKLLVEQRDLVSLQAQLRMRSAWEKGCMLLRAAALDQIGGFAGFRSAMIDDCTLARRLKTAGFSCWVGLTHSALSHRTYPSYRSVRNMVARNAFTQLNYSVMLLLLCTLMMAVMFGGPMLWVLPVDGTARYLAGAAYLGMAGSFMPTLRYYRQPGVPQGSTAHEVLSSLGTG